MSVPPLDTAHRRKVVLGATYRQLVDWAIARKLSPRDVIWVTRPEHLMGLELKPDDIVRLGPISQAMEDLLLTRIR